MCHVKAKDIVEQLFCCSSRPDKFSSLSSLIKISRLVSRLARRNSMRGCIYCASLLSAFRQVGEHRGPVVSRQQRDYKLRTVKTNVSQALNN